jgi:hypothetical protein
MASSPFFKVEGSLLSSLIAKAVKSRSYSVTGDVEVLELHGVTSDGHSFRIEHVEARIGRAAKTSQASADLSGRNTKTQPAGKLRLAAVNGEVR